MDTLPPADDWLRRLLPLIRIHKGLFGRQVTALYEDALLIGTARSGRKPVPLTEEHCLPQGRSQLRELLRSPREIPLAQVRSITAVKPTWVPGLGRNWRFHVDAGTVRTTFPVRPDDADNVFLAFEKLLPGKVTRVSGAWRHLSFGKVLLLLLIFGLPTALGFVDGGPEGAVLFFLFTALMVGMIGTSYLVRDWWLRPRKKKKKARKDRSGRQPFRSRVLGWLLKLAGVAWLVYVIGYLKLPEEITAELTQSGAGVWIGMLLWAPALAALYYGYRLSLLDPRRADDTATQRPFLYLRAFDDDNKTNLQPTSVLGRILGVTPFEAAKGRSLRLLQGGFIRVFRLCFNLGMDTSEEQLAHYFNQLGPFVAIGRPGEALPSPGARRIYVADDQWQQTVLDHLGKCQAVVLQPAKTSGIWWEVEQVLARVEPFRILMCLLNFRGLPNDWEDFRLRIEPLLPLPLPRTVPYLADYCFLYFERDWTPRLQRLSYCSPILWGVRGDATDLTYTLAPFVQGMHGGDRELPRPVKKHPFHGVAALGLYSLVFLVFLLILGIVFAPHWEEQTGNAVKYTLSVRSDWKKLPAEEGTDLHFVHRDWTNTEDAYLRIKAWPGAEDLKRLRDSELKELQSKNPGATMSEPETVTINGEKWEKVVFSLPNSRVRVLLCMHSSARGTIEVRIVTNSEDADFLGTIETICNSVQLPAEPEARPPPGSER